LVHLYRVAVVKSRQIKAVPQCV